MGAIEIDSMFESNSLLAPPLGSLAPARWKELISGQSSSAIDKELIELLRGCIAVPSISGHEKPLIDFLAPRVADWGLEMDVFEVDEAQLPALPVVSQRHIPLAGRPTAVILLKGNSPGPTILFNAHSDVVAAGDEKQWRHGPWSGAVESGHMYGRGACDAKGPLVAALGAMLKIKRTIGSQFAGTVGLEIVPGEEDCVDLGTLTSVSRGYRADAAIVLEPTEGLPRCATRSGLRFEITIDGQAAHGTVKWLGRDAIAGLRLVLAVLEEMELDFSHRDLDPLYADYPLLRPITVDMVNGGQWQGMICDRATCSGYFELCPDDNLVAWQQLFSSQLQARLLAARSQCGVEVKFVERYQGFSTPTASSLCDAAYMVLKYAQAERWDKWRGFNSGCEGGLRFKLHRTETVVWGPGSLAQAHRVDEHVQMDELLACSNWMAATVIAWLTSKTAA
jgi:acetylornithine deacetylase